MQEPTPTKHSAQLNIQENVENNLKKNSTLTEREPIEGTPFTLIGTLTLSTSPTPDQWFMVMGDYRVTETTKTKKEQLDKLETEKWLLIMHICIIALEKFNNLKIDIQKREKELLKDLNIPPYETESL